MIQRVDQELLKFFQKVSDRIQDATGVNNFSIAKFLLLLSTFSAISERLQKLYLGKNIDIFVLICIILLAPLLWMDILKAEKMCRKNPKCMNPNVLQMKTFRLIGIGILVASIPILLLIFEKRGRELYAAIFFDLYRVTLFACIYFLSCTPKIPKVKKVKKMNTLILPITAKRTA